MKTLHRMPYHVNKLLITEAMAGELTQKYASDDYDAEYDDYDDFHNRLHQTIGVYES